jgi:hypothetical protein
MYISPVLTNNKDKYIVVNNYFMCQSKEEAHRKGIIAQMALASTELQFKGEVELVTDTTPIKPMRLYGYDLELGLISGPTFDKMEVGELDNRFVITGDRYLLNNIHIVGVYAMESDALVVAIGSNERQEPFVLLSLGTETEVLEPVVARRLAYHLIKSSLGSDEIDFGVLNNVYVLTAEQALSLGNDLLYASNASEMDAFYFMSLKTVFTDIPEDQLQKFMDAFREYRDDYMENLYAEKDAAEISQEAVSQQETNGEEAVEEVGTVEEKNSSSENNG